MAMEADESVSPEVVREWARKSRITSGVPDAGLMRLFMDYLASRAPYGAIPQPSIHAPCSWLVDFASGAIC